MAVDATTAGRSNSGFALIEDRLEIYNLIASHPPSADTGGRRVHRLGVDRDGVFRRGAEFPGYRTAGDRRRSANPSTTGRFGKGSRIFAGYPYVGSPATRRSRSPYCRSSCRTASVPLSMSNLARRAAFTCTGVSANRWFVRTDEGGRSTRRTLRRWERHPAGGARFCAPAGAISRYVTGPAERILYPVIEAAGQLLQTEPRAASLSSAAGPAAGS